MKAVVRNARLKRFGLLCVAVAGIWGAVTVNKRILFVQTLPAVLALFALYMAAPSAVRPF